MFLKKCRNWVQTLGDKLIKEKIGSRALLFVFFILSLAFFFHYREVRMVSLDVNTQADQYVLAQIGFEFPDTEATNVLKQEAMRDIDSIYRLDENYFIKEEAEFEKELISSLDWRQALPTATFQDLYTAKEKIKERLLESRYTTARTYNKIAQTGLSTDRYIICPSKEGIPLISDGLWAPMEKESDPITRYVVDHLKKRAWKFDEDLSLQSTLRQIVRDNIPCKMTYIEPGERIIGAGEVVSIRHAEIMRAMKNALYEKSTVLKPMNIAGSIFMALLLTILSVVYLRLQHRHVLKSFSKLALLVTIILLTLALAKLTEYILINKSGWWGEIFRYPLYVPFGTLLISILFTRELALVVSGFISVVLGVSLAVEYDHFLMVNLISALIVILAIRKVRRRKEIFEVCAKVWLVTVPIILAFNLFEDTIGTVHVIGDMVTTLLFLAATAVAVVGLLPILETSFDIVTDMMLMEFVDPNHPLLRRLSVEAPGTYHHSLVLGAISETAAQAIGANGLFCRVATLYHDIGKLVNPQYFTENQFSGFNIHQLLTPLESAQVIISHVLEGVALAEKYNLPESFIDIIRQHHGTSTVYCFFHAQVDLVGGDPHLVEKTSFSYGGPKPKTKEAAIIMIGDTVEAAFRSLDQATEGNVTKLIDRLVSEKIEEGQLDECQLTFEEVGMIKKAMVRMLLITRHSRVKYPEKTASYVESLSPSQAPSAL